MKRSIVVLLLAAGTLLLAVTVGSGRGDSLPPTLTHAQRRAELLALSATYGDASPSQPSSVETSYQVASARLSGDRITDTSAVFVLTATGKFRPVRAPRGVTPPTYDNFAVVVDAHTGDVLEVGLTPQPAPVGDLGPSDDLSQ